MNVLKLTLALILGAFALPQAGQAQTTLTGPTNGLWDTGLNKTGSLLAGSAQDQNYNLVAGPPTYHGTLVAHVVAPPLPATWVANPATAQWISNGGSAPTSLMGTWDFQTTLITVPINQVVTISGFIAVDDQVTITVNGNPTPVFSLTTLPNYEGVLTPFTFTFLSNNTGTDFFDYNVTQTNPTDDDIGLLISGITGSYVPVPEPREWSLMVLLAMVGLMSVRKFKSHFSRSPVLA